MVKNVETSSCKVPLFLSDFNETLIFSTGFRKKKALISSFTKILEVGAELFHAEQKDTWTDGYDEAKRRFSQFSERA